MPKTSGEIAAEKKEMVAERVTEKNIQETLMIKPLEQIAQEFLNNRAAKKKAAVEDAQNETEEKTRETGNTKKIHKRTAKQNSVWKDLLFLSMKLVSITLGFAALFTFLFGITRVQDPSMAPAIKDGDLVIFYRYNNSGYLPQEQIVLKFNGNIQVRRVIATAGDTVDITDDGLSINGALQQETGIYERTEQYQDGVSFPLTVPEGQIFVLGDNRINAADSRIYGCLKIKDTFGKVITVIRRRNT